jgi:hypothetical protein
MRAPTHTRSRLAIAMLGAITFVGLTTACASVSGGSLTWTAASTDPSLINLSKATFAANSGVTDAVLAECNLERELPEIIAQHTPVPVVLAEQTEGGARVLTLEVVNILAPGGGAWSGPKSLTLHGELVQEGAVVASFDARRTTTRGAGTCDMLEVIVDALAEDIRPWLGEPTLNARLGEL